jgi:hypothetical protein
MAQWEHGGGCSVDGSVRIEAADRAERARLLRYCARPPFALDRLRQLDPERLLDEGTKPGPGGNGALRLTPLERLDRLAALVPPPRVHRDILLHVGEPTAPPRIAPARGPPPRDLPDAATGDGDPYAQPAPEVEFDQRLASFVAARLISIRRAQP